MTSCTVVTIEGQKEYWVVCSAEFAVFYVRNHVLKYFSKQVRVRTFEHASEHQNIQ